MKLISKTPPGTNQGIQEIRRRACREVRKGLLRDRHPLRSAIARYRLNSDASSAEMPTACSNQGAANDFFQPASVVTFPGRSKHSKKCYCSQPFTERS
jgi:hypothetical protein